MPHTARHLSFIATLSVGLLAASSLPTSADVLLIQGSTTFNSSFFVPYLANIETAAGHTLAVVPNKSSVGLLALLSRQSDLAMISTSLDSEIALLRKVNPNLPFEHLRSFLVYETRAAFAVNPSNPVRSTNADTMRRILLGDISNWRTLGGPDLPLKIVMVRDGGGVQLSVQSALLGGKQIEPHDFIAVGLGEQVVKAVAKEPGALGLTQLGIVQKSGLPELMTDRLVQQQLSLVTFDDPTTAKQAVIDAVLTIARTNLK